jgi:hypothetical protein
MESSELFDIVLEALAEGLDGITEEGRAEFKRLFFHSIHDWYQTERENYRVKCHNALIKGR